MSSDIVIVGAGGMGREIFGIIRAINARLPQAVWRVTGFVDDFPTDFNLTQVARLGATFLGSTRCLADLPAGSSIVLGVGEPRLRRETAELLTDHRLPAANLVHPNAEIGPDCEHGDGLVAAGGARVTTNVRLGRHVHLNQNCTIGHDSTLGDYVSVNPLAAISGYCRIEEGVMVGTTAAVLPKLTVGANAIVGAGACVTRDVPSNLVVRGVPART